MGNSVVRIIFVESGISSITEISNDSICNKVIKNSPYVTLNSETVEQGSHNVLIEDFDEDMLTTIDPFDAVQLAYVIEVCYQHSSQAAAGRYLYANSRNQLKSNNDSDRLRKYLLKFGLRFDGLKQ
jgi:transcriptional regulatory protein RtcR